AHVHYRYLHSFPTRRSSDLASKAGQVELQIQNLSTKPLKILSVNSYNRAYVVDDDIPESIEPGKSGRLLIRYSAQLEPEGVSLRSEEHTSELQSRGHLVCRL